MAESDLNLRGQYLVANDKESLKGLPSLNFDREVLWNGYSVFAGMSLPTTQVSSEDVNVLLLGHAVHHEFHDASNEQLVSWAVSNSHTAEDVIKHLQDLAGRYVALVQDKRTTVAVTDACAMRQLYWFGDNSQLLLSSSPRLILDALGEASAIDDKTLALLEDKDFRTGEYAWYGDKWYDGRINKVLANHLLDMKSIKVHRTRFYYDGPTSYEDVLPYAGKILTGLMSSFHSRFTVIQPLTAGYDSRLLLAASKNFSKNTRYYVFDNKYSLHKSSDVKVATELARKLGLSFEIVMPGELRKDFAAAFQSKCFFPRIMPKTSHIQWHYDVHRDKQILNINGNCGEIVRFHYINKAGKGDEVTTLVKIAEFDQFFAPQVQKWYANSIDFCRDSGINVYDLFYWEQRMSNWGALYPFEQDIAIEEFTPFNHKNLLWALLHLDVTRRKGPQYLMIRDLIKRLWPETLSLPFNPVVGVNMKSRARKMVKRMLGRK